MPNDASQGNYYISFTILSEALEDPSFNIKGIHVVNVILEYVYLGLLILVYILSLGNRPQGAKWLYTAAILGFAVITVYMTVRYPRFLHCEVGLRSIACFF